MIILPFAALIESRLGNTMGCLFLCYSNILHLTTKYDLSNLFIYKLIYHCKTNEKCLFSEAYTYNILFNLNFLAEFS